MFNFDINIALDTADSCLYHIPTDQSVSPKANPAAVEERVSSLLVSKSAPFPCFAVAAPTVFISVKSFDPWESTLVPDASFNSHQVRSESLRVAGAGDGELDGEDDAERLGELETLSEGELETEGLGEEETDDETELDGLELSLGEGELETLADGLDETLGDGEEDALPPVDTLNETIMAAWPPLFDRVQAGLIAAAVPCSRYAIAPP